MDDELRTYLAGMEQRLEHHLLESTQALEQRILDRTQEMVRDAQTEILRGFQRYLDGSNIRLRSLEAETSNLKTAQEMRLANHEERIAALEAKVMMRGNRRS
jgi:hypothetical protein